MFVTRARAVGAALTVTAVVVLGAPPAQAATALPVTLVVDGHASDLSTTASTVGGLLVEQAVTTDSHDRVAPSADTSLTSNEVVTVDHTQPVTLVDSGTTTTRYVAADTYSDAVVELGIHVQPDATVAASRRLVDRKFVTVTYWTPTGQRVAATATLQANATIRVHHVSINNTALHQRIHRSLRRVSTPLVPSGRSVVTRAGHGGVRKIVRQVKRVDGTIVSRRIAQRLLLRPMRARIVHVGTGPNGYARANCESGGNPKAVNAAGYYGLYQFSASTWHATGGKGLPTDWGRHEQTLRAWILYQSRGAAPWPVCGGQL
jgi:uncharacterized protein YabE (DUF348 family)